MTSVKPFITPGARHMLLATFYFALMNIFIKAVSHLPTMEVVFFRCGISLLICLWYLRSQGVDWKGTNRRLLLLRGVFGTASLVAYVATIAHLPLGTAVTIQYLSPIFTTILAVYVLDEKVRPAQWLFFILSFIGVIIIQGVSNQAENFYILIGILSALGSALAYITIRTIKDKEHPLVVVFHFQLLGTITGLFFTAPVFVMPTGWDWMNLILVGLFTQLGQVNMTKSLQMEKVAGVSILNYIGVVYATLAGFFLFDERYSWNTIAGMALVVAGVVFSMLTYQIKEKPASK
ncbi:MAG: DMT family transporter [Bacteroidota bacterium]|jgi:drug/metabolite transporter (DMT)-like permease